MCRAFLAAVLAAGGCRHAPDAPPDATAREAPRPDATRDEAHDAVAAADAPIDADAVDAAPFELIDAPMGDAPTRSPLDEPVREVWPAVERWSPRMEDDYRRFVERLGGAVRDHRCGRLGLCLRDPTVNTLYDPVTDARLRLDVDCADLPYVLRAYYAFKRRLPFGFVSAIRGTRDPRARYVLGVWPTRWQTWRNFQTPREVIHAAVSQTFTLMYRTPPEVENGDFYSTVITPRAVRPGSIYYDPNGHVLVVAEVRRDGQIYFIDGHPDGTLTWKRFGATFALGTRRLGGGFKYFRPQRLGPRGLEWVPNRELADLDVGAQWDPASWQVDGRASTFTEWVRASLATGAAPDPVRDFREEVQALCRDVADRVVSVDLSLAAGLQRSAHPGYLPWNIYGTTGDWETWSTPSHDARLKAAVREISQALDALPPGSTLRATFRALWAEQTALPDCHYAYTNSAGVSVPFSLDTVLDRLFALSFDPAHCPELRWGAPEGSAERASCPDDATKLLWYRTERRLRNRVDRVYGIATPVTDGPETPPDVDPRARLGLRPGP